MKENIEVSVVMPNYNGEDILAKNLPSLMEAVKFEGNKIGEVIIVDDASIDKSVDYIKNNFPEVKIIKHKKNRGFSSAINTGVRSSRGEFVVLLNNDVAPAKNFLENVFVHFLDPKVFAVSLHEKGYSWAEAQFRGGFVVHEPGKDKSQAHKTFWVSGGSGIFRRDCWMKLGGMDEKLFTPYYWEDLDLSYRAMKRGFRLLWEPKAVVNHNHESTISKLSKRKVLRIQERNELLFIWKNITSVNLFRKHMAGLLRRIFKGPGYLLIIILAICKLQIVLKERKREKKESKVSDEAIFAGFV